MRYSIIFLLTIFLQLSVTGQNCDCLISEVENNNVTSCNYTIGTVVVVSTESEFVDAINQANNSGGNLTILIADGTYQVASTSWYPYITANNVVIRSQSGNRDAVVLVGHGMTNVSPDTEIGIYAVGNNITIADLTIKDVGNHGIAVTGNNLFVYNVKIQNTFEQMIKGNSTADGIVNGQVKCSLFEYTNGIGPQWYIGGLDIHRGINWIVSDNVFRHIASPSVAVAEHAVHFWDNSVDNTVERNIIVNCDRGIGFGLGDSANNGGMIKNNMISNDGSHPFHDVGIGLESSPNTNVYNNSVFIEYQNAIEYRFEATENVMIGNNLTNKIIKSRDGGTANLANNIIDADANWFVNIGSGNLRLAGNIPEVVNNGVEIVDVIIDIDKIERPQLSNHDIGASEYVDPVNVEFQYYNNINVFPNPASTQITCSNLSNEFNSVFIYDNFGQLVSAFSNQSFQDFSIDVSRWNSGIYHCVVKSTKKSNTSVRIIVTR